jgi:large subunit ribosomal protein L20
MPRANNGSARNRRKVRLFKRTKGFRGYRRNHIAAASEAVVRAGVNAYRDRRRRKREFRQLWIIRLSAACEARGLPYSRFIQACQKASIALNRKMLSELAIHDPAAFDAVFEKASAAASSGSGARRRAAAG